MPRPASNESSVTTVASRIRRDYDATIEEHYREIAKQYGSSPMSTMADVIIRERETQSIFRFVADVQQRLGKKQITVADVGCGNGYTLDVLADRFPGQRFIGIEKCPELLEIASSRCSSHKEIEIRHGDIRESGFLGELKADVLICQRVLINILDRDDQALARDNLVDCLSESSGGLGGAALFWECFDSGLSRLNDARAEFELEPIAPAYHNLYLCDDFFADAELESFYPQATEIPRTMLSTHYFISRVLNPALTKGTPFKRNSHFSLFFSEALPDAIGDYAPLQVHTFARSRRV